MRIAVVGTGYVGLVTGTCFAETGNDVICVDVDQEKLKKMKKGNNPHFRTWFGEFIRQKLERRKVTIYI